MIFTGGVAVTVTVVVVLGKIKFTVLGGAVTVWKIKTVSAIAMSNMITNVVS